MDKLEDDVRKLMAWPPYDHPANIVAHDGYFARSLDQEHGPAKVAAMVAKLQREGKTMPNDSVKPAAMEKPTRPKLPKTPLIEKLGTMRSQLQGQVDFLKWLDAKGRLKHLAIWNPEDWVAEFHGFDMDAIADERKAITDYAAAMQTYWGDVDAWRARKERGQ